MPAPSRPRALASSKDAPFETPTAVDRLASATRIARALAPDELSALVQLLEDRRDGAIIIVRHEGEIVDIHVDRTQQPPRARIAV